MSNKVNKLINALSAGALLVSMLMGGSVFADNINPFGVTDLNNTHPLLVAESKCGEGKCGGAKEKKSEGKCGEGKCGDSKTKKSEGKCGEGKCGGDKARKPAAKCGEGKCGGNS